MIITVVDPNLIYLDVFLDTISYPSEILVHDAVI
jgi:hypothetical protein